MSTWYPIFAALLGLFLWLGVIYVRSNRVPLPPGPPRKFIVGNLFDIPKGPTWPVLAQWKEKYGDIVYIESLGSPIVILNTLEAVNALFDKRGTNYSHRPIFTMAGELMGLDRSMVVINYGKTWREHRKLTYIALNPEAVKQYYRAQERIALLLLNGLLDAPQDFDSLLRLLVFVALHMTVIFALTKSCSTAGRTILAVTYGLDIMSADDDYIVDAEAALVIASKFLLPGAHIVDLFPFLKHIPKWAPFARFHREADAARQLMDRMVDRPYNHVKMELAQGHAPPSFVHHILADPNSKYDVNSADFQTLLTWTAGTMYGAGSETTYAAINTFILAMTLFPNKQAIAQGELDRVVGTSRLPTMEDRSSLPYIEALIKETLRWHVILPQSIPRRTDKDDVYKGYFIPAGTLVIPNLWFIAFDSTDHPEDFTPERYLTPGEPPQDPRSYCFGFGRRICPGKQLADNSLFITIASILSVFAISKEIDELGNEIPVHPSFGGGLVRCIYIICHPC
ncbi:hypothetical protein PILCRDRAFT_823775 [Piloderma croceum F 1598]|uniref:Cytochrome P450 n=1 Tax=Piloderma croceum (strain F 1598) TaxID=765440 RepID=A0A0C3FHY1_PILCF|nr:hypothetical protein PILCRDRAFT_823775 [Piloderma croceum F 1598]